MPFKVEYLEFYMNPPSDENPYGVQGRKQIKLEWKIDDEKPKAKVNESDFTLTASGEEIDFIFFNFKNVPLRIHPHLTHNEHRECIWRGEMARFIYENL